VSVIALDLFALWDNAPVGKPCVHGRQLRFRIGIASTLMGFLIVRRLGSWPRAGVHPGQYHAVLSTPSKNSSSLMLRSG